MPAVPLPGGVTPAVGFCLFLVACGPVELFHLGTGALFSLMLAFGLACEAATLATALRRPAARLRSLASALHGHGLWQALAWAAMAAVVVLVMLRWVYAAYNMWDDYQGYLVFPNRILQQGWLGDDVLDLRRVEMGLGGASYLSALFLAVLDSSEIRAVDAGVGSLLILMLLLSQARRNRLGGPKTLILFGAWAFFIALAPLVNTSAHLTAGALFLAFIVLMREWGMRPPTLSAHVLIGLLLAGAAILKAQYLVPAIVFPASVVLWRFWQERSPAALSGALVAAVTAVVLFVPWMWASHLSIGSAFFPFLGTSTSHSGSMGHITSVTVIVLHIAHNLSFCAAAGALAYAIARQTQDAARGGLAAIAAADITVLVVLFNVALSGAVFRYYYSFTVLPLLFLLCEFLGSIEPGQMRLYARRPLAWACALAFGVFVWQIASGTDNDTAATAVTMRLPDDLQSHLERPNVDGNDVVLGSPLFLRSATFAARAEELRKLQLAVPAEAPLVALLDFPFVLDFRRQPIYVLDFPGTAGPGAGLPFDGPAEAVAEYLRSQGLRYLAFTYFNQALHTAETFKTLTADDSYVLRTAAARTLAVQARIGELKRIYPAVYDDRRSYVLDLATRPAGAPSGSGGRADP